MVSTTRAAAAVLALGTLVLAGCERGGQPAQQATTSAVAAAPTSTGPSGPEAAQQACDAYHTQHEAATKAWNAFNKAVPKGTSLDDPDAAAQASKTADALSTAAQALQSKLDELGSKLNDGLKRNLTTYVNTAKKAADDLKSHAGDTALDDDASYLAGASKDARAVCGIK